jgi:aspartyl protease family protein
MSFALAWWRYWQRFSVPLHRHNRAPIFGGRNILGKFMRYVVVALLIATSAGLLLYFGDSTIVGDVQFGDSVRAFIYGAMALSVLGAIAFNYRGRISSALLGVVAWIAIFVAVMVGYTYRAELDVVATRVMDEVVPGREVRAEAGEAVAVRSGNGHFAFDGITNGVKLRYLFDTGASTVVLRNEDAKRIGLDVGKLDYSVPVSTANGRTMSAAATIDALTIGNITQRRVRALVGRPGALQENLLGMSFLSQLKGYAVEGNRLVLRQ